MKKENNAKAKKLLSTKIKDLTPAILKKMEIPLGTSDRPYPMWGSQVIESEGYSDIEQVLSVIADDSNPMKIYSERDYKEVMAMAYCDMPTPSMLPLFFDGLERRRPESRNRTQMMIGDPGFGKSFMGAMHGRMRSKAPVEVYDCGGKNMNELLFEMVLDFGAGDALPKALDKRLKAGVLEALSVAKLKKLPSKSVTLGEDGNVQAIDWNFFKGSGATPEDVDTAFNVLKEVSHLEGLDNAGGNALGMNSQYGPLIKWFLESREGVLDEYNKSREGTDNALQTVWQFMNGELDSCTVENPLKNKDNTSGPSSFTFRREDMPVGFFVTLTGNKTEDGLTTRSLNKSVYSRLSPQTLPDPDVIDWQHRICQMMVGVPVSTLYAVFKDQADKDPTAFGEWLLYLRQSKADISGVPVPDLEKTLLTNWQNVISSSEKLARFYDKWATLTDADKIITSYPNLIEEVDEEYSKKEGIDFRKIKQHLEEAIPLRPRMEAADASANIKFGSWDKKPAQAEKLDENLSLAFGSRLVEFLERVVYEKTMATGKPNLYKELRSVMRECSLRDINLKEASHSKQMSVEDALNLSNFDSPNLNKQAEMARKVFCDYIRHSDAEIQATDDQIVTIKKFKDALKRIQERETQKGLFVINRDHETLGTSPIVAAKIEDQAFYDLHDKEMPLDDLNDLVSHDDFMASLALPTVSNSNLSAVWDNNLTELSKKREQEDIKANSTADNDSTDNDETFGNLPDDEAIKIAENRSEHKLATTTLRVSFEDASGLRDVAVHIVRNESRNKTLVVGEKLPSKLLAAFKEASIIHVDRNSDNAEAKIEAALRDVTRNLPDDVVGTHLPEAFNYRNRSDAEGVNFSKLMASNDIEVNNGKYLVKVKKPSAK